MYEPTPPTQPTSAPCCVNVADVQVRGFVHIEYLRIGLFLFIFKFFVLFTIYALIRLAALCFCSAVTRPSLICLPPHPSHVLQDLYILSNMRSALFRQRGYTFIQFTPKNVAKKM